MNRIRGFTLLEVSVTSAVFGVIILMVLSISTSSSRALKFSYDLTDAQEAGGRSLNMIAESLREARIAPLPDVGTNSITLRIPVDHDEDGDFFDSNLDIEWGVRRDGLEIKDLSLKNPGSSATFFMTYRYQSVTILSEDEIRLDLNNNGSMEDIFQLGRIEVVFSAGDCPENGYFEERTIPLSPSWVLQLPDTATGDIDGDGQPDPIFFQDGDTVTIKLLLFKPGMRQPAISTYVSSVVFRNPQN